MAKKYKPEDIKTLYDAVVEANGAAATGFEHYRDRRTTKKFATAAKKLAAALDKYVEQQAAAAAESKVRAGATRTTR